MAVRVPILFSINYTSCLISSPLLTTLPHLSSPLLLSSEKETENSVSLSFTSFNSAITSSLQSVTSCLPQPTHTHKHTPFALKMPPCSLSQRKHFKSHISTFCYNTDMGFLHSRHTHIHTHTHTHTHAF